MIIAEIMIIAELRHLDGIKGSLVIANGTDYAGVTTTEEGTVMVDAHRDSRNILFSVFHIGTGIDPEVMPRLFTKFPTKSTWAPTSGCSVQRAS